MGNATVSAADSRVEVVYRAYDAVLLVVSATDVLLQLYIIFVILRVARNTLNEYRYFLLLSEVCRPLRNYFCYVQPPRAWSCTPAFALVSSFDRVRYLRRHAHPFNVYAGHKSAGVLVWFRPAILRFP